MIEFEQCCAVCGKWLQGNVIDRFDYIVCGNKYCQEHWQDLRSDLIKQGRKNLIWHILISNNVKKSQIEGEIYEK